LPQDYSFFGCLDYLAWIFYFFSHQWLPVFPSDAFTHLLSHLSILYNLSFVLLKPQIQIGFLKDTPKLDPFLNAKRTLQVISDIIPAGPFSTKMSLAFAE